MQEQGTPQRRKGIGFSARPGGLFFAVLGEGMRHALSFLEQVELPGFYQERVSQGFEAVDAILVSMGIV